MLGFIETSGSITETNQAKAKRRRAIPMVAHAWGIHRRNWARAWLQLRKKEALDATKNNTLMPACGPDWQLVPGTRMTSDALTIIVRTILQQGSMTVDEAKTFTSHSMNTTFLSWCGKADIGKTSD